MGLCIVIWVLYTGAPITWNGRVLTVPSCEQAERQRTFNHTWAFSSNVLKDTHEEWSNTYFVYTAVAALVSIAI